MASATLCTSGSVLQKAGKNVSIDISSPTDGSTIAEDFINQAEAHINAITRFDWVTNFADVNAEFIKILEDTCSSMAAKLAICYDMSGYTGLLEATTMIDVNHDIQKKNLEILRLQENQEKII